jgi:putative phosphoesterase
MATIIGVISDTHWPTRVPAIPWEAIEAAFAGVSLILHAGDIETPEILDRLRTIASVEAVRGDDDHFSLPVRRVIEIGGKRIGLTHGQRPFLIERRGKVAKLFGIKTDPWNVMFADLLRWFADDAPDAIVFGHWHRPYNGVHDGVLLFNPGAVYAPTPDMFRWQMTQPQPFARRLLIPRWLKRAEALPPDRWPIPTVGLLTIADEGALSTQIVDLPRVSIPQV